LLLLIDATLSSTLRLFQLFRVEIDIFVGIRRLISYAMWKFSRRLNRDISC